MKGLIAPVIVIGSCLIAKALYGLQGTLIALFVTTTVCVVYDKVKKGK